MTSAGLHGLFDIQSGHTVASPPVAYQKDGTQVRQTPSNIELDDLTFGLHLNGPTDVGAKAPNEPSSGVETPKSPNELEMSRPSSPLRQDAVSQMQSWNNPPMNRWRILCCCLIYFGNGLNDSVVGALIPYMETHYRIGYAIVSMVFVGNAAGFITAAFFTNLILGKLGRAKTMILGEVILLAAYITMVTTPPFPVVVIAFFILGYGAAINLALNNVFCANLHPPSAVLGAAHGSYGIGGIVAPILGTALVSNGILWSRFYFVTLGLRFFCIASIIYSFWSYKEDRPEAVQTSSEGSAESEAKPNDLALALKNRVTIFGALFIFAYQGAEVAISGWMISFLINYRQGNPAQVGNVTAGFWGGITLGRFVLTHLAPKIGEKKFVVTLVMGVFLFQLMAWLIPNIIGNAVAVAILGVLLGPVYPCAQTIFSRLLPRNIQTTAIGFIGGAGSSGGAVAPFTTGLLAQATGTWVLHPVCIGMYVVMLACWFGLPRVRKRTE